MKNAITAFMLAGVSIFGIGFTSCQNEDIVSVADNAVNEKVFVTLEATIDNDATRSTLTHNPNALKFGWEKGDRLEVINITTGESLGYLYANEPADPTKPGVCTLSGEITKINEEVALRFYYLGSSEKQLTVSKNESKQFIAQPFTYDFASQDGGKDNLADNDLLVAEKNFPNGTAGSLGTITFSHHFAVGRFQLVYNDGPLSFGNDTEVTISAASGNFYSKSTLSPKDNTYTDEGDAIVVTTSKNDFFVYLVPSPSVSLKFTSTVNGEEFVGTIGSKIESGKFYTKNDAPLPVVMKHSDGRDDYKTYILHFNQNCKEDNKDNVVINSQSSTKGLTCNFPVQTYESLQFNEIKAGCYFSGWNTEADGSGTPYSVGDTYTMTYNPGENGYTEVTLYAQWERMWTVKWMDGYSTEPIKTEEVPDPDNIDRSLYPNNPTRSGYEFVEWSTTKDEENKIVVITAQWRPYTIGTPGYDHGTFN